MTKVFISSVDVPLRRERDGLAAVLRVVPSTPRFEPIRFEDFVAQDRSSREACLAGVTAADVVVLLLGPTYGSPRPDSTISPTQEEFEQAQTLGRPILAFVQDTSTPDEARQVEFKARVQDYASGYFRASFTDPLSLNEAVLAALGGLQETQQALVWTDLTAPVPIVWRADLQEWRSTEPWIDLHLLPVGGTRLRAHQLAQLPERLTRLARDRGFFTQTDPVQTGASPTHAGTARQMVDHRGGSILGGRREDGPRGILVHQSGQVTVFDALPYDFISALVDHQLLQQRLAQLLPVAAACLGPGSADVAPAAALGPLERIMEGDPGEVGHRRGGPAPMRRQPAVGTEPSSTVTAAALTQHVGDVAADLATSLLVNLRQVR